MIVNRIASEIPEEEHSRFLCKFPIGFLTLDPKFLCKIPIPILIYVLHRSVKYLTKEVVAACQHDAGNFYYYVCHRILHYKLVARHAHNSLKESLPPKHIDDKWSEINPGLPLLKTD